MARTDEMIPDGITPEAWDAAYRRVSAYLAALGVRHEFLRHRLVQQVMDRCAARLAVDGAQEPVQAATDEIERQILDWFRAVLGIAPDADVACEPSPLSLRGRLAMLLASHPTHWHGVFLTDPPWPEDFVRTVRASYLEAVPALRLGRMAGPPLDLGRVPQLADQALRTLDRSRWLRVLLLWGGFAALFGFVFWFTR